MATVATKATAPRMSDAAVKAKTGKTWAEWFTILDKAGARKMGHREIVALLSQQHDVGPWWQQMVTVISKVTVPGQHLFRMDAVFGLLFTLAFRVGH